MKERIGHIFLMGRKQDRRDKEIQEHGGDHNLNQEIGKRQERGERKMWGWLQRRKQKEEKERKREEQQRFSSSEIIFDFTKQIPSLT